MDIPKELINSIARRIKDEHRKHSTIDWPEIAAIKIIRTHIDPYNKEEQLISTSTVQNELKYKVVMLPTEKASKICLNRSTNKLDLDTTSIYNSIQKFQHLYILSDEEIKEGDWIYYKTPHGTILIKQVKHLVFNKTAYRINATKEECFAPKTIFPLDTGGITHHRWHICDIDIEIGGCKKIVATTDKSLEIAPIINFTLPQLPASFVQVFIKAYNEGKLITEVNVEIEFDAMDELGYWTPAPIHPNAKSRINVNKYNEITITSYK